MTRYFVQMGHEQKAYRDYYDDRNEASEQALFESGLVAMRDRMRDELMPAASNNDWVVSDIAKWSGAGSRYGYAFLVRHMNGAGVATGREYLFMTGIATNSGSAAVYDFCQNPATGDYFFSWDRTDGQMDNDGNIWMMFTSRTSGLDGGGNTPGADAFGFGFSDFNAATLSGGDFTAPSTSPYTNFDGFININHEGVELKGWVTGAVPTWSFPTHWCCCFEDDVDGDGVSASRKSALFTVWTQGRRHTEFIITMSGDIITPEDPADTEYSASVVWWLRHDADESGASDSFYYARGHLADGSIATLTLHTSTFFTRENSPRASDGLRPWEPIGVSASAQWKGWGNTNLWRVMGVYNREGLRTFSGPQGPFIKYHQSVVFPWVPLEAPFPPIRYNIGE